MPQAAKVRKRCESRRTFETLKEAQAFIARQNVWDTIGGPLRAYQCRNCQRFHIGHPQYIKNMRKKYGDWLKAKEQMTGREWRKVRELFPKVKVLRQEPRRREGYYPLRELIRDKRR